MRTVNGRGADWSSVPYPPWWIERAIVRRREWAVAVDRLRAVVAADDDIVGALAFGRDRGAARNHLPGWRAEKANAPSWASRSLSYP